MQLHKGKVKFAAGAPEDRGYGLSINVPFDVPGQPAAVRVYCKITAPEYAYMASLQKGQEVDLMEDKGKFKIVVPAVLAGQAPTQAQPAQVEPPLADPDPAQQQAPRAAQAQPAAGVDPGQVRAAYLCRLYAAIWSNLQGRLIVSENNLREATDTVFQEAAKGL